MGKDLAETEVERRTWGSKLKVAEWRYGGDVLLEGSGIGRISLILAFGLIGWSLASSSCPAFRKKFLPFSFTHFSGIEDLHMYSIPSLFLPFSLIQFMATGISQVQVLYSGFSPADKINIDRALERIQPSGGTALLDAILESSRRLKKLCGYIAKTREEGRWHLYHVIITDGEDTMSQHPSERVKAAILDSMQGTGVGSWDNHVCCILAGDIRAPRRPELRALQQLAGTLIIHYLPSSGITESLQTMRSSLIPPYGLLLTVDISYSMQEYWTEVKEGIRALVQGLDSSSVFAVTCFHEEVMTIDEAQIPTEHKKPIPPQEILPSTRLSQTSLFHCPTSCSEPSCLLS